MEERIMLLGFALVFIGMIVMMIGSISGVNNKYGGTSSGFAVGGFIGPIPSAGPPTSPCSMS